MSFTVNGEKVEYLYTFTFYGNYFSNEIDEYNQKNQIEYFENIYNEVLNKITIDFSNLEKLLLTKVEGEYKFFNTTNIFGESYVKEQKATIINLDTNYYWI